MKSFLNLPMLNIFIHISSDQQQACIGVQTYTHSRTYKTKHEEKQKHKYAESNKSTLKYGKQQYTNRDYRFKYEISITHTIHPEHLRIQLIFSKQKSSIHDSCVPYDFEWFSFAPFCFRVFSGGNCRLFLDSLWLTDINP